MSKEVFAAKVPVPFVVHSQAVATALEVPTKETSLLFPHTICPKPASTTGAGEMVSVIKSETAVQAPWAVVVKVKTAVVAVMSPEPGVYTAFRFVATSKVPSPAVVHIPAVAIVIVAAIVASELFAQTV